jgi:hypothetical protein
VSWLLESDTRYQLGLPRGMAHEPLSTGPQGADRKTPSRNAPRLPCELVIKERYTIPSGFT